MDLNELERLAKEATPGPWKGVKTFVENGRAYLCKSPKLLIFAADDDERIQPGTAIEADADYIAAASPATVLALIERLRATEAETVKFSQRITNETLERYGFKGNRIATDEGELVIYCDYEKGGARSASIEIDSNGFGYGGCTHSIDVRKPKTECDLRHLLWALDIPYPPQPESTL